jgi:hypothetical protein
MRKASLELQGLQIVLKRKGRLKEDKDKKD